MAVVRGKSCGFGSPQCRCFEDTEIPRRLACGIWTVERIENVRAAGERRAILTVLNRKVKHRNAGPRKEPYDRSESRRTPQVSDEA